MKEIDASNPQQEKVSVTEINPVLIAKKIAEKHTFIVDKYTKILWIYDKEQGIYTEEARTSNQPRNGKIIRQLCKKKVLHRCRLLDTIRNTKSKNES